MFGKVIITDQISEANTVTHGSLFHADEVFATVILSAFMDDVRLMRVNNIEKMEISESVLVFDTGLGTYDHHQRGGNGKRKNGVPYAACGLIWRDFGKTALEHLGIEKDLIDQTWLQMDSVLIQGIDAVDNGVMPDAEYPASNWNISRIINSFNPVWYQENNETDAFLDAVSFAETVFLKCLDKVLSTVKAKAVVDQAIRDSKGQILVLDRYVPWQGAVFANPEGRRFLFTVFPAARGGYSWQGIPVSPGTRKLRLECPSEWHGEEGEKLQQLTGIKTAVFCHPSGFLGGCETFEDAYAMAQLAITCASADGNH